MHIDVTPDTMLGKGSIKVRTSRFTKNRAQNGGAIVVASALLVNVDNTAFTSNQAVDDGGAIWLAPKTDLITTFKGGEFEFNHASTGGGVYLADTASNPKAAITDFNSVSFKGNWVSPQLKTSM